MRLPRIKTAVVVVPVIDCPTAHPRDHVARALHRAADRNTQGVIDGHAVAELGSGSVPVWSVPMKLPSTSVLAASLSMSMPSPMFPEIRLRASATCTADGRGRPARDDDAAVKLGSSRCLSCRCRSSSRPRVCRSGLVLDHHAFRVARDQVPRPAHRPADRVV